MSLLGVISRQPVHVRAAAPKGSGWGFVVREASKKWTKSIQHGDGSAIALHLGACDWTTFRGGVPSDFEAHELTGDVFVATLRVPGDGSSRACMLQASPWQFAYEGAIGDNDALRRVLDPTPAPAQIDPPGGPGELIFARIMSHLLRDGAAVTADVAMAKAAADLHRARSLGPASFICADGTNLYAYSFGRKLLFKHVPDAILVGSPQVLAEGPTTHTLQDGALVVLAKRPYLGWAVLAHP